jgi:oxygen-independent coproporphyrinogen-3 oxidase
MVESPPDAVTSLYVHVPFCAKKCSYCAFYSEASDGETVNRYVSALAREMERVGAGQKFETVFFGGGTPSLLNLKQWERIISTMERLGWLNAREWTVECNPATISLDKARLLKSSGVNRISMGVQSLDEQLLERLGRVHTRAMVFKSFDILRQAGFDNVNLDLMFAIPGQTVDHWRDTLCEALAMGGEHLSSYEVIYEEDTVLYAQLKAGEFDVDEDLACAMYEELVQKATGAGFEQYEVANFARKVSTQPALVKVGRFTEAALSPQTTQRDPYIPALACRHNVNYWRGGSFYGLGPSATGYIGGVRTRNVANTIKYCERIETDQSPVETLEQLPPLARAGETAAFGLRMVAGWPFEQFRKVTGHDLRQGWAAEIGELTRQGWGRLSADRFQLTTEGLRFADAAAELFLK